MTGQRDQWEGLSKRPLTPEEEVLFEADVALGPDWSSPFSTASLFLTALQDPIENAVALGGLIAPSTRDAWGDFIELKFFLDSIEDLGMSSSPVFPSGNPGVAYVKLLRGVSESFVVTDEQLVMVPAVITLSFSQSRGMWLVYGVEDWISPERVAPTP